MFVVTNVEGSPLTEVADHTVLMHAGEERGGVSCRSYTNTQVLLLALEAKFTGVERDLLAMLGRTAEATQDLLDRQVGWLPETVERLAGPDVTAVVAPFRRLGNAQQSALMLREGPRRPALASETGEWSHVDVYLTKTLDYRMLLLPGSRYEGELLRGRGSAGRPSSPPALTVDGADLVVRYRHDDDEDVRLLTELMVAELVAADLWQAGT